MDPPEPGRPDPQAPPRAVCYHEAAHAVVAWRYGLELECVSVRPDGQGHRGHTQTARHEVTDADELETEMKCSAAGAIAERLLNPGPPMSLTRAFEFAPARAASNPDLADFTYLGRARDEVLRNVAPDALTGPEGWVRIWQQAEDLIRNELWPAIQAVAEELETGTGCLNHEKVAALASPASLKEDSGG
jgi:hypothetical protein